MKVSEIVGWWRALDEQGDAATGMALFGDELDRDEELGFVEVTPRDARFSEVVLECDERKPARWIGVRVKLTEGQRLDRARLEKRFGTPRIAPLPIDYHVTGVEQLQYTARTRSGRWTLLLLDRPCVGNEPVVEPLEIVLRRHALDEVAADGPDEDEEEAGEDDDVYGEEP